MVGFLLYSVDTYQWPLVALFLVWLNGKPFEAIVVLLLIQHVVSQDAWQE